MNQDNKGRFVSGNCANPGGRKKGVAKLVRELSDDYIDYFVMLDAWARDKALPVKERRACITELLNRSMGMPTQRVKTEGDTHVVIGLKSLDEALADIEE